MSVKAEQPANPIDVRVPTPTLSPASDQPETGDLSQAATKSHAAELPHIGALDGVRGVAILMVLIVHGRAMGIQSTGDDFFMRLSNIGFCGVDLFFVLSGFLITRILLNTKHKAHFFKSFYGRRLVRIFPLFYAFLFVAFYILPDVFDVTATTRAHQWWYWTYMTNVMPFFTWEGSTFPMSITWSLAVEEHFYMLWPAVVFLFSTRTLRRLVMVLVPATFALRVAFHAGGVSPGITYGFTFCRMDALLMGAFVAMLAVDGEQFRRWRKPAVAIAIICVACLCGIFVIDKSFNQYTTSMQTVGFTSFGFLFASLIVLVLTAPPNVWYARTLNQPILKLFGKYSYSIYLIHIPIQIFISSHIWGRAEMESIRFLGTVIHGQLIGFALLMGMSLLAGFIIWHLFERHFLKLKRYFSYG